nr:hypothetical protein Iba_chr03aCG3090 [Ipomoea batatas]GME11639.1 hypothetical protein Iba_scaffold12079CG0010 [Ipomoea batatas]
MHLHRSTDLWAFVAAGVYVIEPEARVSGDSKQVTPETVTSKASTSEKEDSIRRQSSSLRRWSRNLLETFHEQRTGFLRQLSSKRLEGQSRTQLSDAVEVARCPVSESRISVIRVVGDMLSCGSGSLLGIIMVGCCVEVCSESSSRSGFQALAPAIMLSNNELLPHPLRRPWPVGLACFHKRVQRHFGTEQAKGKGCWFVVQGWESGKGDFKAPFRSGDQAIPVVKKVIWGSE